MKMAFSKCSKFSSLKNFESHCLRTSRFSERPKSTGRMTHIRMSEVLTWEPHEFETQTLSQTLWVKPAAIWRTFEQISPTQTPLCNCVNWAQSHQRDSLKIAGMRLEIPKLFDEDDEKRKTENKIVIVKKLNYFQLPPSLLSSLHSSIAVSTRWWCDQALLHQTQDGAPLCDRRCWKEK